MGVFRVMAAARQRFCATLTDKIDDASVVDRRRQVVRQRARAQIKLVATDVSVVVLKDTGHWIFEERPKETTDALIKFL